MIFITHGLFGGGMYQFHNHDIYVVLSRQVPEMVDSNDVFS